MSMQAIAVSYMLGNANESSHKIKEIRRLAKSTLMGIEEGTGAPISVSSVQEFAEQIEDLAVEGLDALDRLIGQLDKLA